MAENEKKEELVRYRNRTDVTQIIHHEGNKIHLIAEPVKGTIMLPPSVAAKYRRVLEPVE